MNDAVGLDAREYGHAGAEGIEVVHEVSEVLRTGERRDVRIAEAAEIDGRQSAHVRNRARIVQHGQPLPARSPIAYERPRLDVLVLHQLSVPGDIGAFGAERPPVIEPLQ